MGENCTTKKPLYYIGCIEFVKITMGNNYQERLKNCLARAVQLFEKNLGFAPQSRVDLQISAGADFAVSVAENSEHFNVSITQGTVTEIDRIWDLLWETPVLTTGEGFERLAFDGQKIDGFEELADLSLTWLLMHELMHAEMGHLAFAPEARLIEVGAPEIKREHDVPEGLDEADLPLMAKCFEMQADSEATDVFLGPYDKDRWSDLRVQGVCIFVVMALIERENVRLGNEGVTHPKAGTRFITLMGHLFQMWLYPNATLETSFGDTIIKTPEAPNEEEFKTYAHAVLTPLVGDTAYVAGFCDAYAFLKDVGGTGELFQDVFSAQYAEHLTPDSFATEAAREWFELRTINERMMTASGRRH